MEAATLTPKMRYMQMGTYPALGTGWTMVIMLQHQQVSEERGKGHLIILGKSATITLSASTLDAIMVY